MSNRTVAIVASVMAAVSFLANATAVRLSYTGGREAAAASFDVREVTLTCDGVRVRVGTAAGSIDLDISVHASVLR